MTNFANGSFFVSLLVFVCTVPTTLGWRQDIRFNPWTLEGKFIQGTPLQCNEALEPENGRWVCSYGFGEAGRSLCMVDCRKNFMIQGRPLIFNCGNGQWKSFPTPDILYDVPYGRCVPVDNFDINKKSIFNNKSRK